MPFNSNTYHRNKARREAFVHLQRARDAKREQRGADNVQHYVRLARLQWRTYLSYLRMKRCDDDLAALRAGRMTYAAFMERWG
jgi:hypothetical protein